MEYFTFEELKEIKARVLHLHSVFNEVFHWYYLLSSACYLYIITCILFSFSNTVKLMFV